MVRTAWRVLGRRGREEVDDVVQEGLLAALTTPALPTGDVGAWLRAITARKALDAARRTQRRAEEPLPEAGSEGPGLAAAGDAESRLDVLLVRRALATLKPVDRAVLVLSDLEGRPLQEVARMLGLSYMATRVRASRARRRLAHWLRQQRGAQEAGAR